MSYAGQSLTVVPKPKPHMTGPTLRMIDSPGVTPATVRMIHSRDHEAEELSDNRKALRKSIRDRRIALQVSGPEPWGTRHAGYESQHYYISTNGDPGFGISPKHNGPSLPNGQRIIRGFFALDKNGEYTVDCHYHSYTNDRYPYSHQKNIPVI
jgi:hypothetical protein